MIDGNNRTCLGESVSLNYCITELAPKLFKLRFDARSPGDKGPEFPTESSVDPAKSPPACNDARNPLCPWSGQPNFFREMPLDFVSQGFQHSRDGHNYRYPVVVGQSNEIAETDF